MCHPLLTFWKRRGTLKSSDTFHILNETNPNQSQVIVHHKDNISFRLQLSARPQFICHLNLFCDIYKGIQCALWFQSSFFLPKVDKQVMKSGQQALQNYRCTETSITSSHTHTHTSSSQNEWTGTVFFSSSFFQIRRTGRNNWPPFPFIEREHYKLFMYFCPLPDLRS